MRQKRNFSAIQVLSLFGGKEQGLQSNECNFSSVGGVRGGTTQPTD